MATIQVLRSNGTPCCSYNVKNLKLFEARVCIQGVQLHSLSEYKASWTSKDPLVDYKEPEVFILNLAGYDQGMKKQPGRYLLVGFKNSEFADTALYNKL